MGFIGVLDDLVFTNIEVRGKMGILLNGGD